VKTATLVVRDQPRADIGGDAGVISGRIKSALEHVDASLRIGHADRQCKDGIISVPRELR
jgi:hypothetical protein